MDVHAIGLVHSSIKDRKEMPPFGVPAQIGLFPEFRDGLLRLEKHSHVWVLAWMDQADRQLLQVTPRGVTDSGPQGLHGVFAVRSPVRPNPIGLTATHILPIDGLTLRVDPLDFVDGTPIIDLKPYFSSRDIIFSAVNVHIGLPSSRAAMRESLIRQAESFHGERCADLLLAARIVEHFRAEVLGLGEPKTWQVAVPLRRPCLIDAIMGITRATPGRGGLRFGSENEVCIHHEGVCFLYCPRPASALSADIISQTPDEGLFEYVRKQSLNCLDSPPSRV